MADIFDEYTMSEADGVSAGAAGMAAAWDEMFERPGQPRAPYRSLFAALQPLAPSDLRFRADQLARVFTSGVDLVRDEQGRFRVLEDNLRIPSGVSYVMENRRAMTQTMPALFTEARVMPVDDYPARLLAALRAAAPEGVDDPCVVVLTPGVYNAAYFEHALLARLMGVELVEGRDLVCSGNRVRMLTTQGERPVHVVYRRVDDEFIDPLHFRPDSVIGCPGIVNAARAGAVTPANAIGNRASESELRYTPVTGLR